MISDRAGRGVDTELLHDLRRRSLDRPTADQRAHRDHRRSGGAERFAQARHGQDGIDAQVRVRRADDDRAQARASEYSENSRRHPGRGGVFEDDRAHDGCGPQFYEVLLEGERRLWRVHQRADGVVAHRQQPRRDAESPPDVVHDGAQGLPGGESSRALQVQREVAVAELKPGLARPAPRGCA